MMAEMTVLCVSGPHAGRVARLKMKVATVAIATAMIARLSQYGDVFDMSTLKREAV